MVRVFLDKIKKVKQVKRLEEILCQNNFSGGIEKLVKGSLWFGFLLSVLVGFFCAFFNVFFELQFVLVFFAFFLPLIARILFHFYFFDFKIKKMEELSADLLLFASLFPKGITLVDAISKFSKSRHNYLSKEFRKCLIEIQKGAWPELALENMKRRLKSRVLSRVIDLLVQGIKSGADASIVFKETAADILETNSLIRERASSMIVEKYTLLFAGGILVPLVFGIVTGLMQELDFSALSEIGIGLTQEKKTELFGIALIVNQIYLAEYALIASFFVAFQESDPKKAIVYALFLLPVSFFVFFLAKN